MKLSDLNFFAIFCACLVALFWGMYGPTLANARSPNREWGPFKPYVFIGVAYLLIAIVGGSIMMKIAFNDNFDFSGKYFPAMKWGFLAGCLGALGASVLPILSRWSKNTARRQRLLLRLETFDAYDNQPI